MTDHSFGCGDSTTSDDDTSRIKERLVKNRINDKSDLSASHISKLDDCDTASDRGESDEIPVVNNEAYHCSENGNRKRRRKRRRVVCICTTNCRYEVVRRVACRLGMREVGEDDLWHLYWSDLSISTERCKDMKRFQKINHFPGMSEICRKDLLARNLNRMQKLYPEAYSFFPKTWCLPADMADVMQYARFKRNTTFILKPEIGCQGRGIIITKSIRDIRPTERMICQVYVSRPFLIDGLKFDFRVYTLITSCDPLRIYVYNDGLVRFATSRYKEPTGNNAGNLFMHLTNYAVNKHSRMYIVDDVIGSKRKISTLNRWFEAKQYNLKEIWANTDDVIIKTVIAAYPMLKHSYNTCFPTHDYTYACFELLGFDILLDENLKPYVLEVNHSPSFHTDSQIDRDIKECLLRDTFQILNLKRCDKKKILDEDRRRVRERLLKGIYKEHSSEPDPDRKSPLALQAEWEENHKGNFRKVYPCEGCEKYDKLFHQSVGSLFQETAASRAREEASRVQREEAKAKQDAAQKILYPPEKPKTICKPRKTRDEVLKVFNSFQPLPIIETEELDRLNQMRQREFLIKSCGLIEQICLCLRKNRAFPAPKKPSLHEWPVDATTTTTTTDFEKVDKNETSQACPAKSDATNLKDRYSYFSSCFSLSNFDNAALSVQSSEAPMSIRPSQRMTLSTLPPLPATSENVRPTKAQVARAFTNTAKLRQLERRIDRHADI